MCQSTQYIIGSRLNRVETNSDQRKHTRGSLSTFKSIFIACIGFEVHEWYARIHIRLPYDEQAEHCNKQPVSTCGSISSPNMSSATGLSKMWCVYAAARQLYDTLTGIARYEYWINQSITQRRIIAKYFIQYTYIVRYRWTLNHWMPITQPVFGVFLKNFFNKIPIEPMYAVVAVVLYSCDAIFVVSFFSLCPYNANRIHAWRKQ